jgi:hypothetical protein
MVLPDKLLRPSSSCSNHQTFCSQGDPRRNLQFINYGGRTLITTTPVMALGDREVVTLFETLSNVLSRSLFTDLGEPPRASEVSYRVAELIRSGEEESERLTDWYSSWWWRSLQHFT